MILTQQDMILLAIAYLLGSIPFGLLITKIADKGDIRSQGSGNIGATNVLRVAGKKLAVLTLICDALKGVIAVILARIYGSTENIALIAAFLAVIGHVFPIWIGFKGGKGVATMLAVLLTLSFPVGFVAIMTWLIIFKVYRISSLSSISACFFSAVFSWLFRGLSMTSDDMPWLCFALSLIVILRHIPNIKRLLAGTESPSKL